MVERWSESRGPGIHVPPPFVYAAGFLLGMGLHRLAPLDALPPAARTPAEVLGVLLIASSAMLGGWAMLTFLRARTAIIPFRPASRLVAGGPFRYSRNPMYVAMTLLYLGLSLVIDQLWPLALLPLVLVVIDRFVIAREERHLRERFGEAYDAYRAHVPRWVGPSARRKRA